MYPPLFENETKWAYLLSHPCHHKLSPKREAANGTPKEQGNLIATRDQISSHVKAQLGMGASHVPIDAADMDDAVRTHGKSDAAYHKEVRAAVAQICNESDLAAVPGAGEFVWYFRHARHR